jgi:hypothetical protein
MVLETVAVIAVALLAIGVDLFWFDDGSTLTSPPEAVAEGFTREVVTRQYDRALPYLEEELADRIGADGVRRFADGLGAIDGRVLDVLGIPGTTSRNAATAAVEITTVQGTIRIRFGLVRRSGVWHIGTFARYDSIRRRLLPGPDGSPSSRS